MGYMAALGAATCWAFTSILAVAPVRSIGPIPFNAFRMLFVGILLTCWLLISRQWSLPNNENLQLLLLSGFIGIFMGDTLLFLSMKILGPRMAGLLFAINAPLSFLLSILILRETYDWYNVVGAFGVMSGVLVAIAARSRAGEHAWEQSLGHVGLGLLAGFAAAACQSIGTLIIFDLLREGQNPILATTIRVWIAVVFLIICLFIPTLSGGFKQYKLLNLRLCLQVALSGILGMAIGMSLLLWAIKLAPLGTVVILSATTPVILLPILWFITKKRPARLSGLAAVLVVAGTAMLFIAV